MSMTSLEERVAILEAEVAHLKKGLTEEPTHKDVPWWGRIYGTFKDDPLYEEAMALGRAYRESLRPRDDETPEE